MSNTEKNELVKAIRFKDTLFHKIAQLANERGLTFNDVLEQILKEYFDIPQDPVVQLNSMISQWLNDEGYSKTNFPEDIIFLVFEMIRTTPNCLQQYGIATLELGEGIVNRRIGLFVKQILNAEVKGRSVPFGKKKIKQKGYLIKSYSFLKSKEPSGKK